MYHKPPVNRNLLDTIIEIGQPPRPPDCDWYDADMLNGWLATPGDPPQYALRKDGTVMLDGKAYHGYWGQPLFQLPVGYRPEREAVLSVQTWSIGDPSNVGVGQLVASPNGWVYLDSANGAGHTVVDLSSTWFRAFDWTSEFDDITLDLQPHLIMPSRFGFGWMEPVDFYATTNVNLDPDFTVGGSTLTFPLMEAIMGGSVVLVFFHSGSSHNFPRALTNVEILNGDMTFSELDTNIWIGTAPDGGVTPYWRLADTEQPEESFMGYNVHTDTLAYGAPTPSGAGTQVRLTLDGGVPNDIAYEIFYFRGVTEAGATGTAFTGSGTSVDGTVTVAQNNSIVVSNLCAGFDVATPVLGYGLWYYPDNSFWTPGPNPFFFNAYRDAGTLNAGFTFPSSGYEFQAVVLPGQYTTARGTTSAEYY